MSLGKKRKLDIDLRKCDWEFWLAALSALERRYGDRWPVTDDPLNPQPMQRITDLLAEAAAIYAKLPVPPRGN